MSENKLKEIFESHAVEKTISVEMKITPSMLPFLYQIGLYSVGPKQKRKRRARNNEYTDKRNLRSNLQY